MKKFIFGILFGLIILPFAQDILTVIEYCIKFFTSKLELSIAKTETEVTLATEPPAHQIGFSISSDEEYYDDEEGDE